MQSRSWIAVAWVIASMLAAGHLPAGDTWPTFQGPRVGELPADGLALAWTPKENLAWQMQLPGYGQSSPVVFDGQVYVTTISGPNKEHCQVSAYDVKTGKELWQHKLAAASQAENTNYVSKAAPTPVVDAEGLVVLFEGGNLLALAHDGSVRWQRDLVAEYGPVGSRHGLASSLEHQGDRAFVWIEREADPYLLAVSKGDGKTIWKQPGLGVTSWSSPRLIPVAGKQHLVLSGIGKLAGYDPADGTRLWEFDDISGNSTPTPVPAGDGKFLIGATAGRGDGDAGAAAASNGLVQISQADGKFQAKYVWRAKRATCSFGSPAAHNGLAYFVNRSGVAYCLDLETGEELYAQRTAGGIWATPIAAGGKVYLFGRNGTTSVIKAGREFELLATNELWENDAPAGGQAAGGEGGPGGFGGPVLYAAVVADGMLILRRGDVLYAVRAAK